VDAGRGDGSGVEVGKVVVVGVAGSADERVVGGGCGGGERGEQLFQGRVEHVAADTGGGDVGSVEGAEGGPEAGAEVVGGDEWGRGRECEVEEVSRAAGDPGGEDAADDLGDEDGVGGEDGGAGGHVAGAAPGVIGAGIGGQDGGVAAVADGGVRLEEEGAVVVDAGGANDARTADGGGAGDASTAADRGGVEQVVDTGPPLAVKAVRESGGGAVGWRVGGRGEVEGMGGDGERVGVGEPGVGEDDVG